MFLNLLTVCLFAFMLEEIRGNLYSLIQIFINKNKNINLCLLKATLVEGQVRFNNAPLELESGLKVTIKVSDTSRMDGASNVLATTVIENPTAFPISFQLEVDQQALEQTLQHTVSANIIKDDKLLYITDQSTEVNKNGNYNSFLNELNFKII